MKQYFPFYKQPDTKDCWSTYLRIISKFKGKNTPLQQIRHLSKTMKDGGSLLGLSDTAENLGFWLNGNFKTLIEQVLLPSITH